MPFQAKEHYWCARLACLTVGAVFAAALFATSSQARDRNAEQQMKEFAREQRQEERRRQQEQQREAREQEKRAKEMQAEQARAAQERAASAKSSGFASGNSNTTGQASPAASAGAAAVKNTSSTSTSDSKGSNSKAQKETQQNNTRAVVDAPSEPPRTVEKWLQQLTAPKVTAPPPVLAAPKVVAPAPSAVAGKAKAIVAEPQKATLSKAVQTAPASAAQSVAKAIASKPRTGGTPEPIEFPDVPLPEVLAVNATAATVARAKSLGFTATPATSLASLDLSVTRLLAPQGMSAGEARAVLEAQVPGGSFAPNMKYRIYKTAAGGLSTKPSGVPPTPAGEAAQTCSGDRCFAQNIIGWKPELRKCAAGLKVGIIDTSVDISHPTFRRKQIEVRHFGPKDRPGPNWHGTGVAALLAGDDKSATPGLIPDASFYVADIFLRWRRRRTRKRHAQHVACVQLA